MNAIEEHAHQLALKARFASELSRCAMGTASPETWRALENMTIEIAETMIEGNWYVDLHVSLDQAYRLLATHNARPKTHNCVGLDFNRVNVGDQLNAVEHDPYGDMFTVIGLVEHLDPSDQGRAIGARVKNWYVDRLYLTSATDGGVYVLHRLGHRLSYEAPADRQYRYAGRTSK